MLNAPALNSISTMSSLEIAKLTDKEHKNVLADIRTILGEAGIRTAEFSAVYINQQGKEQPCFNLPRRECDLVISGYSVKYRLAIIDRWQELENQTPNFDISAITKSQLALMVIESEEEKAKLLAKIDSDAPKVEFAMAVRRMEGSCQIGEFCKTLSIGRNKFFKMLRDDGILMDNNIPYQKYIDAKCFVVIEQVPFTDSKGKSHPVFTTMVTGKGQVMLECKYRAARLEGKAA